MEHKRKRKVFELKEKIKIIQEIEDGKSQAQVARENSLNKQTVSEIWKNREKVQQAFLSHDSGTKKLKGTVRLILYN